MLILVAHGSRSPEWRQSVERVVEAVQAEVGSRAAVRLAYMDLTPPTLMDVAREAVQQGVRQIRVLPLFLANQGHVDRDILPLVDAVRIAYPDVDVTFLPAVGQQPQFRKMLYEIAVEEA